MYADAIETSMLLLTKNLNRPAICDLYVTVADVIQSEMRKVVPSDMTSIADVMRQELASFKDEIRKELRDSQQSQPTPSTSYASAVSKKPTVKTPISRPALVMESSDPSKRSHKDVIDAWKKNVSFKKVDFAPARIQAVSNNKVRVEFDTVQQRDAALGKLTDVPALKSEESRRRRPMVILKGISKDTSFDDGVDSLVSQNPRLADVVKTSDSLKLRFKPLVVQGLRLEFPQAGSYFKY